jgi:hypothetical protein
MRENASAEEHEGEALADMWQEEQRKWQQLILTYIDAAATDERFLMHLGNAMRGSLLANKPYPGTTMPAGTTTTAEQPSTDVDELVFTVRRLEGQIAALTMAIDALTLRVGNVDAGDRAGRG